MSDVIRLFCVVSCFVAGIYGCIIYYYFRSAKRMLWFAAVCFSFGIQSSILLSMNSYDSAIPLFFSGIAANILMASVALSLICLNNYTGLSLPRKYSKVHMFLNFLCLLIVALSLVVPAGALAYLYATILITALAVYGMSTYSSVLFFREGKKYAIFLIFAYAILFISTVVAMVLGAIGIYSFNSIIYCTPVFLALHGFMVTKKYQISKKKTGRLATSLSDTIERINHSDNALMCTQMKADFLYRSLDLISRKCDEDAFTAEDLTVSLSKYLRHTLNFQQLKGIVPLNNEIELTKAFISIEKERNRKIAFEYKFPDPIPEFHIPPLSIQPLVENAIYHAFPEDQDNPKITISIISYRDYYHIDISDNGRGMDEETVQSLTESLHESARIGIYNIHTRLINLFGKGLVIQSAPGVGTSISFVVPPDAMSYLHSKEGSEQ